MKEQQLNRNEHKKENNFMELCLGIGIVLGAGICVAIDNISAGMGERLLSILYPYGVIGGIEWSPDGSKMVFGFHPNYGNGDIYVIDVPAIGAR